MEKIKIIRIGRRVLRGLLFLGFHKKIRMFNLTCSFESAGLFRSSFVLILCSPQHQKSKSTRGDLNADRVVVDVKYATHTLIVESPFVDFVCCLAFLCIGFQLHRRNLHSPLGKSKSAPLCLFPIKLGSLFKDPALFRS